MKTRILFVTAAVLAAALSLVSCSKNEPAPTTEGQPLTLTLTMPGNAGTRAVFEENIQGGVFKGLKTKWELGDEISVGDLVSEEIATFKAVSVSDDGKTATFAGNALAAWGTLKDGDEFWSSYPAEVVMDWRRQDGTLANLPDHDFLWIYSMYSAGGLIQTETPYRGLYIFRFPKGFAFCDKEVNGNVTLEFSGEGIYSLYDIAEDTFEPALGEDAIQVGPVSVTAGALDDDVYVAMANGFEGFPLKEFNIGVIPEDNSWVLKYKLEYYDGMESGNVYTITSVNWLQLLSSVLFVDLGLPSGLKWASRNLGASRPEGSGYYFTWGETEPKDTYSWNNYFDTDDGGNTFNKYAKDKKTVLEPENDAAFAALGGNVRMPTKAEWEELIDYCDWEWQSTDDGYAVNGYLVSGSNTNTIFLPAAGYRGSSLVEAGSLGLYWSSSLSNLDTSKGGYMMDALRFRWPQQHELFPLLWLPYPSRL